ncbi:MAG TPA: immunoglobulin domain-containing protein, partial [Candidatus Dormibacteraeota bacterium]|nr:immunoglobulin domain-containing protein [Candidatus Dormibacteraeota bacterium]
MKRFRVSALFGFLLASVSSLQAAPDLKFDVVTFCCNCGDICTNHFDHLNFPTTNGHYLAMGGDTHRLQLATNGNALAVYFNTLNDGWTTNSGAQQASNINQYAVSLFTTTGPRPDWVVLNEISSGLWPSDASYRAWVRDVVHALRTTYGFNVIVYSPFPNPGNFGSDWQAVATDAYVGIENYLSGSEVQGQGFSVSYCQSQYQSSVNSYTGLGVPKAKLMLGELFGQTTTGTSYGRAGIASNAWDQVITARNQAVQNVAFAGFLSYAWGGNSMGITETEQLEHEDAYRTNNLPVNSGLTVPAIVLQPQSQTLPNGSDVAFIVFKAGIAPTTYQWRLNGTNISGAIGSSLNLSNIQVTNAGNYSVVLSNAVGKVTSSNAFLSVRVPDPFAYEPFAPATTSYAAGANLIGQTNVSGQHWTQAGPSGPQPTVQAGNLNVGGLAGPIGNSVKLGGNGISARFNPGTNTSAGTWYFSFAFRLTDISTLNSGGVFWSGFNNVAGTQLTTPNSVVTRLLTRSATGGYNIGLDKSSGNANGFVFSPTVFTTNDTVFLVGSYTFNSGTTSDDVSQLWINPDPSTFGLAVAPSATLTNMNTNDIAQIASFVLFNRSANEPAGIIVDELRLGSSWASVTPPAEAPVPPTLNINRSGNASVLSW